jgi:hypothetical protein
VLSIVTALSACPLVGIRAVENLGMMAQANMMSQSVLQLLGG